MLACSAQVFVRKNLSFLEAPVSHIQYVGRDTGHGKLALYFLDTTLKVFKKCDYGSIWLRCKDFLGTFRPTFRYHAQLPLTYFAIYGQRKSHLILCHSNLSCLYFRN